MSLCQFSLPLKNIPTPISWYLAGLGETLGQQELFAKHSLQRLNALRGHSLIESAVSSSRIEGVMVDQKRIGTIIFGKPPLRDRNEQKLQGYRDAL